MSQAPDYFEPIMGVRKWHVKKDGLLYSTGIGRNPLALWPPSTTRKAACADMGVATRAKDALERPDFHFAPDEEHKCGLYAWVDLETCCERFHEVIEGTMPYIAGVVSAWGEIIPHGYGFRAEYMAIEALIVGQEHVEVLGVDIFLISTYQALANRYDVPLICPAGVDKFMKERGVVLEADPPEEEDEPSISFTKVPVGTVYLTAGKPIQAGAQLAADPSDGSVHHRGPGEEQFGVAASSAKAGRKVMVATSRVPSPPPSWTPLKPVSQEHQTQGRTHPFWAYGLAANLAALVFIIWSGGEFIAFLINAVGFIVSLQTLMLWLESGKEGR